MPSDVELAWCAGFFDGEGSTFIVRRKRITLPPRAEVKLSIGQAHPAVLERFVQYFDMGKVRGPYLSNSLTEFWMCSCQGPRVDGIMRKMWPYLDRVKRQQYITARDTSRAENREAEQAWQNGRRRLSVPNSTRS